MNTLNKFSAVLGVLGVVGALTLSGCETLNPFDTSSSGSISAGNAFSGSGVVQSINLLPANNLYRFTIRMDNGANQTLTNPSTSGFNVGDRVRIDNGSMRKL